MPLGRHAAFTMSGLCPVRGRGGPVADGRRVAGWRSEPAGPWGLQPASKKAGSEVLREAGFYETLLTHLPSAILSSGRQILRRRKLVRIVPTDATSEASLVPNTGESRMHIPNTRV